MILVLIYLVSNELARWYARIPRFPGPRGLPIVGNLWQLKDFSPERLRQWSKIFGDVFQIQLGNEPVLVVNSAAAAKELFLHQGHALNSRPTYYTFHQIFAAASEATSGTSPMSPDLKRRRRTAASTLIKPAVVSYAPHLDLETRALVQDLLESGRDGSQAIDPMPLIRRFALSMVLTLNWGRRITIADEGLLEEITNVTAGQINIRVAMSSLQDYIPIMRLMPFSKKTRQARELGSRNDAVLTKLDNELHGRMRTGSHASCVQSNAILGAEAKLSAKDLRTISTSLIQGGSDTISATLLWALAHVSLHREVQDKAYAEMSAVYPSVVDVLSASTVEAPDFADKLPYLHALGQECLRYFTVLMLSLPRTSTQSTSYDSRLIPAGTTFWLNAWACNMDSAIWDDPEVFRPERWLEQPNAPLFTYGLGHRMCIGVALANRELELVLLRVLGGFEIQSVPGFEADASPWTGSMHRSVAGGFPKPYEVFFKPRSEKSLRTALAARSQGT